MRFLLVIPIIFLFSCKKEFPDVQTKVLGHAGESLLNNRSKFPPNTLDSGKEGLSRGTDGYEIDVQMTADGELVVYHDERLDDNSDGEGCINNQNWSDLIDIKVYKSEYRIAPLSDYLSHFITEDYSLLLDVKHYNACEDEMIDYVQFNQSLNTALEVVPVERRGDIIVNCRKHDLMQALTDTLVKRSLESDDPEYALPLMGAYDFVTIKLAAMNSVVKDEFDALGKGIIIYNVKSRSEVNRSLEFDPEFVISDNIDCTIKAIHGKE